ncbi:amidohydrolase 2 [Lecanosticta acicola]|uniref:Amidohydrolase 2 n=1 Tax=Lecanosticta acicola TaxID=111012 RepID=A0AAI8Z9F1_9PEZI|nr:amidohydrolase 2 [Lecanosticta acicola]
MPPPLIALEEHFDSNISTERDALHMNMPKHLTDKLSDISENRISDMDAGGLKLQVISHTGLNYSALECRQANDKLAAACRQHPNRLAGFAMLPMRDPQAAADELERTVKLHGFLGALVNDHLADGTKYDDEKFWKVFEKAVELDVPVYIHPSYPGTDMEKHYRGNFDEAATMLMSTASWGWHSECGLHILRLFAAGLFDRLPTLKVVIGHMGEMLPYMLPRIMMTTTRWGGSIKRDLRTVWKENIWVTTSGLFALPSLELLLKTSPRDKVMFSVDYPFSTPEMGLNFVRAIEASGLMDAEQLEAFCHGNAESLLKVSLK